MWDAKYKRDYLLALLLAAPLQSIRFRAQKGTVEMTCAQPVGKFSVTHVIADIINPLFSLFFVYLLLVLLILLLTVDNDDGEKDDEALEVIVKVVVVT